MKTYTQEEIDEKIELHEKFLSLDTPDGSPADFSGADLRRLDFSELDLRYADFSASDLTMANFYNSDLRGAFFWETNLSNANFALTRLTSANFHGAILIDTCFDFADMRGVYLRSADFSVADLYTARTEWDKEPIVRKRCSVK
jgi:uncharacterized protein YjbI with pentapeptide repeats